MKILVLAPQPFLQDRGTPIATLRTLRALAKEGHDIDLLTYHEGSAIDVPRCRHYRTPFLPGLDAIPPGFSLRKVVCDLLMSCCAILLCCKNRYDVVHAVEESVFIAMAIRVVFGPPYVYDMDSSLPEQLEERFASLRPLRRLFRFFEGQAIRRSRGVVVVCDALAQVARSYGGNTPVVCVEDVSLLHHHDAHAAESCALPAKRVVMYVGNLQPYQGIDLLVDAFSEVSATDREVDLVVVGGAPTEIDFYRSKVRGLNMVDRVHFLGPRPVEELGGLLAGADLVVSPRISGKNTPMKVFSYLDSGTPVLATALPTHTQILDAEISVLVPAEPHAMAEGMRRMLADSVLCRRLAAAAKQRVADRFSPEVLDRRLIGFYRELRDRIQPKHWAANG